MSMRLRFVSVRGKDSGDFLHRLTAGTVKGVLAGTGRGGLLLNGQSRVLAQFDLLRTEDFVYLLAAPEVCAQALAESLAALHFAEDLEVALTDQSAGVESAPDEWRDEQKNFVFRTEGGELSWPSPVSGFRHSTQAKKIPSGWEFARIGTLVPWPPYDWSASTPALEAGMLPWIDRFKGCYPGQEVVELSLNVGHPVRVLVAVETETKLEAGAKISWDGAEALVTSVASSEGMGRARALLRLPWGKKDFLPPGFARLRSHW